MEYMQQDTLAMDWTSIISKQEATIPTIAVYTEKEKQKQY